MAVLFDVDTILIGVKSECESAKLNVDSIILHNDKLSINEIRAHEHI